MGEQPDIVNLKDISERFCTVMYATPNAEREGYL